MSKEEEFSEIQLKAEEILGEKYMSCKDDNYAAYMEPLLIDYSLLISSSSSQKAREELIKFRSSLTSWGCFQLINHGIETWLLDEAREVCRQFFALAIEEKQKYASSSENNGYEGGVVASPTTTCQDLDWNEAINLTVFPEHRRQLKPESPPNFKKVFHEYSTRLTSIFDVLFKLAFQSLNVDEETLAKQYGKNKEINVRVNFYPKCPGLKPVLGLKAHADFSPMTLNLQYEEGLQILKDEQWFMVPVIPHALFLNLGDPIEIMTNGIFKSAVHRVVTNTKKERLSIVAFWDSDRYDEVGPLDEFVSDDRPQLYQRVSLNDYRTKFFNDYQSGKRTINNLKF